MICNNTNEGRIQVYFVGNLRIGISNGTGWNSVSDPLFYDMIVIDAKQINNGRASSVLAPMRGDVVSSCSVQR